MDKVSILLTEQQASVIRRVLEADDENTFQFVNLLDVIAQQNLNLSCGTKPIDMFLSQGDRFVFDAQTKEETENIAKFIELVVENAGVVSNSMWGDIFPLLKPHIETVE